MHPVKMSWYRAKALYLVVLSEFTDAENNNICLQALDSIIHLEWSEIEALKAAQKAGYEPSIVKMRSWLSSQQPSRTEECDLYDNNSYIIYDSYLAWVLENSKSIYKNNRSEILQHIIGTTLSPLAKEKKAVRRTASRKNRRTDKSDMTKKKDVANCSGQPVREGSESCGPSIFFTISHAMQPLLNEFGPQMVSSVFDTLLHLKLHETPEHARMHGRRTDFNLVRFNKECNKYLKELQSHDDNRAGRNKSGRNSVLSGCTTVRRN